MRKKLALPVLLLLLVSCSENGTLEIQPESPIAKVQEPEGMMVLGEKLNNPYSVVNMRKAYAALSPQTKSGISDDDISATHRYVKFIPKTEDELSLLKTDSTLILYQYPLDYEIIQYGSYRDPDIPDGQPTPLYCSVPIDKVLPDGVETVILEDLYIPDEYGVETRALSSLPESFVDALVEKSFILTGNEDDIVPQTKGKSKWVPQGSVRYYDSVKGQELPIEGLQIRCHRWFTTYTAYTKNDGTFKCGSSQTFKNPANYSIVYERYDFEIRDGFLSTAKYDGPKDDGAWNVVIKKDDKTQIYYSTIFRAAYRYYYGNIYGISRPPQNDIFKTQLKIKASKEDYDGARGFHKPEKRFAGLGSQVQIYTLNRRIDETYATAIHELSHAAHWGVNKSDYNNISEFVKESWARGVEVVLSRSVYPCYNPQFIATINYSGIVLDLLDKAGIKKECRYFYDFETGYIDYYATTKNYIDNVSGYTLLEIECSLNGVRNANGWKNNLKNLFNNETENYLDDTFSFWSIK